MALAQLDITATQEELAHLLGTRPGIGTPFSRIQQLKNMDVQVMEWCGLEKVATALFPFRMMSSCLPGARWQKRRHSSGKCKRPFLSTSAPLC
jgi:hypothetical protein